MKRVLWVIMSGLLILSLHEKSLAANPPAQIEMSGQERTIELEARDKEYREKIEKKPKPVQVDDQVPQHRTQLPDSKEKTLIREINVMGVTLVPQEQVKVVTDAFLNKELTMREMQKAADMITDIYRKKGYVTSRAYLPPQKISGNILEIRVIEGIVGNIEVKGNRFFKSAIYKNHIDLKKGEPFSYTKLQKNLRVLNEHPDRSAKAVLVPGKEAGQTDVVLEVKDNLPIHPGFTYDNYGSRYVDKDRFLLSLTDNNLTGLDDMLTLQFQFSQRDDYRLAALRYILPVTKSTDLGVYVAKSKIALGKEYEDTHSRGKSKIYSTYLKQSLVRDENFNLNTSIAFDYKNIYNFINGDQSSADLLRILKWGVDLDLTDKWGRTIFNNQLAFGIPNIMGGLGIDDPRASRSGSGGKFNIDTINLLRLQKMPFSSTLLWKNQMQFSPYILTASEEYQLGGIANVRGYPAAEAVGDNGYTMTWEYSVPPYFVPKDIRVPYFGSKLYDAIRFVGFYDWGNVRLKRVTGTQKKNKTLSSGGLGLRFNLAQNFSLRLDVAWPLAGTPSDENHARTWIEASLGF